MKEQRSVLISGGGIAGLAAAYWLDRVGFRTSVAEQFPGLRGGGQAVDVRGVALDVVRRMDLLPQVSALRTKLKGMSMFDSEGNEVWRSEERTLSAGRLDSEDIEILRDDLQKILYDACPNTEFFFGSSLTHIEQTDGAVRAEFDDGTTRQFDLLVGADGLYSKARSLVFGSADAFVQYLGMSVAIFSIENILGLKDWQAAMWGETAGVLVYPARDNKELRVFLGFEEEGFTRGTSEQYKALVADRCASLGWEVPRLLDAMKDASDFYFGPMAQVHMDAWSKGQVVLLGDAGYCSSPKSGQGTSLALVGAYVLAEELRRSDDDASAFEAYEARMRPFVDINQKLALRPKGEPPSDEAVNQAKNFICL